MIGAHQFSPVEGWASDGIYYINSGRNFSLNSKDRLCETEAIEMESKACIGACALYRENKPTATFSELATRAHDMEHRIAANDGKGPKKT